MREKIRVRHYSIRNETQYVHWAKRFIQFHNKRHPNILGAAEVEAFLTHLAVVGNVAALTQNQALSSLLFLYREVLGQALIDDFDLSINSGSLGLLSIYSQNFGDESVLQQAMPGFLAHLQQRRNQIWLAASGQIAQWWRDRERFRLSSSNPGKRLDFNVTVKGNQPINGATVIIMLPEKAKMPTVRSTKIQKS